MDDRQLVRSLIEGREAAWEELLSRFGGLVYHVVRGQARRLGPEVGAEEADDAFAAVVVALLEDDCRRLREFEWKCSLATWLRVVAARCASNHFRNSLRKTSRQRRTDEEALLSIAGEPRSGLAAETPEGREERELVRAAMSRLAERERLALTAFHVDGRSYAEVARLLRVPASSVSQIVARARAKLRELLLRPGD